MDGIRVDETLAETDTQLLRMKINSHLKVLTNFKELREEGKARSEYIMELKEFFCNLYGYNTELMEIFFNLFSPHEVPAAHPVLRFPRSHGRREADHHPHQHAQDQEERPRPSTRRKEGRARARRRLVQGRTQDQRVQSGHRRHPRVPRRPLHAAVRLLLPAGPRTRAQARREGPGHGCGARRKDDLHRADDEEPGRAGRERLQERATEGSLV